MKKKSPKHGTGLSSILELLLIEGVKSCGSFNPQDVLNVVGENLTLQEHGNAYRFLQWIVDNKRTFGYNIKSVWAEWQESL